MTNATIERSGNTVAVRTKYIPALIPVLRDKIDPRRRWDSERKAWIYPAESDVIKAIGSALGVSTESMPDDVRELVVSASPKESFDPIAIEEAETTWPGTLKPFRHQAHGLAELLANDNYLLAWEMGTGKSAVIAARLAVGLANGNIDGQTLIVCPKNVIQVWPEQLKIHGKLGCEVLEGDVIKRRTQIRSLKDRGILVTNYEMARIHEEDLRSRNFAVVVCDESHRIKDLVSKTNRAIRKISAFSKHRWALSGTPSPNGPLDICGTIGFVNPQVLGTVSITALRSRYAIMGGYSGREIVAYKNVDDLDKRVATVTSRLTKEQAIDLPPKTFETRYVTLTPNAQRIYNDIRNQALARLANEDVLTVQNILTESLRLLQIVGGFVKSDAGISHAINGNAKLDMLADIVEDIDRPVLIWASFVEEVEQIAAKLKGGACIHHGGMHMTQRTEAIRSFIAGRRQFFVSTPASAREGLTLTNSDTVIYYSRGYNLLDWLQSQDRVHRIGQTRPVTIISLVARNTVDERVAELLEKKISLQELVLSSSKPQDYL